MPFYRDSGGEPHFFFGRERYVPGWRASNKLSSFGGGAQLGEDAVQTAAREFREESLDSFQVHGIEAALRENAFALRVLAYSHRASPAYHATYFVECPPGHDAMTRFSVLQSWIARARRARAMWYRTRQWISRYNVETLASLPLPSYVDATCDVRFAARRMYVTLHYIKCGAREHEFELSDVSADACRVFVKWAEAGRVIAMCHHVLQRACPGILIGAELNDVFLEVDAIQCWSYSELKSLDEFKQLHAYFRREFLPIAHAILREFAPITRGYANYDEEGGGGDGGGDDASAHGASGFHRSRSCPVSQNPTNRFATLQFESSAQLSDGTAKSLVSSLRHTPSVAT